MEGGGGKRVHKVFWECFFHCGEAREGSAGVILFTNSLWDRGKGAPGVYGLGFRVTWVSPPKLGFFF